MRDVRIHDTVHGYIVLPWKYVAYILDTFEFQRLRRIEQTAIRSVYPTARHDRFVHSLGVFHIGNMILQHFLSERNIPESVNQVYIHLKNDVTLQESYRLACLLHDVGHAPFSHSFESYYGGKNKEELAKTLSDSIANYANETAKDRFIADHLKLKKEGKTPAYHEYTSAIVSLSRYGNVIRHELSADAELIARMITGCKYHERKGSPLTEEEVQLRNIFIELLHSDFVDADRLDYACRDIWASGYSTSSVDVYRLIESMHIRKDKSGNTILCYDYKALNEIESVLEVRSFQNSYVINHHTIVYDQYILQKAAEKMAVDFFKDKMTDFDNSPLTEEGVATKSLAKIININSLLPDGGKKRTNDGVEYSVANIADEDLLFLMKQSKENSYYQEWAGRQYNYFPLWKSPDEFHEFFPITRQTIINDKPFVLPLPTKEQFESLIKKSLHEDGEEPLDIIVVETKFKAKVKLSQLQLLVNDNVMSFGDLYPFRSYRESVSPDYKDEIFYYVYCKGDNTKQNHEEREAIRKKIIARLQDPNREFLSTISKTFPNKDQTPAK